MKRVLGQITALAMLLLVAPAEGTQHLVRPGEEWSDLAPRLKPGDEVILMPGRHKAARLDSITGHAEQPIVIRGLDPAAPSVIAAGRYGLRLTAPRHVVVEHITIIGASVHALAIEGDSTATEPAPDTDVSPATMPPGHVTIRHVTLQETGPRGQRHAMLLRDIERAVVVDCHIEGWAGSGIEIVACQKIDVENTTLVGRDRFAQVSGIRVRAGSEDVEIEGCRLIDFGEQGVSIGAGSPLDDFATVPAAEAEAGSLYEATNVRVHRTVFDRGQCAVSFVNCLKGDVRYCTIVNTGRVVVSVRREQTDARFGTAGECAFDANLITWDEARMTGLTHLGPGANPAGISVGENVWWGPGELVDYPGEVVFPQITDLDPGLDESLRPTAEAASLFGATVP